MKLSNIIPKRLAIYFVNLKVRSKYDVTFEKGACAGKNSFFEGRNLLKEGVLLKDCRLGLGTYIAGNSKLVKAKIGRFCSIGQNVRNGFGLHPTNFVSTHPGFYSLQKQASFTFAKKQLFREHKYIDDQEKYHIEIGNDVWIGNDVKIMDGVRIGDGAIVATGAIVNKDVAPYSIVGGLPAKHIRFRFTEEEIDLLLKVQWWNKDVAWIEENAEYFVNMSDFKKYCTQ